MTTIGSLFTGYGGLDMGVAMAADPSARVAWTSDVEPGPCKLAEVRWPDTPNLGDITQINWADVEPVDIICGGSPCQDLSLAGKRAGMATGTRSGLWESMAAAVETIRPRLVVWAIEGDMIVATPGRLRVSNRTATDFRAWYSHEGALILEEDLT